MSELVRIQTDSLLNDWTNAQRGAEQAAQAVEDSRQSISTSARAIRAGELTTGDKIDDFFIGSFSDDMNHLADFAGMKQRCIEMRDVIRSNGGQLIFLVRDYGNEARFDYSFGRLNDEPDMSFHLRGHDDSEETDRVTIGTTKYTSTRLHMSKGGSQRTVSDDLAINKWDVLRLLTDTSDPQQEQPPTHTDPVELVVGNRAVEDWFKAYDDRHKEQDYLEEFYNNCCRVGFEINLPDEVRQRFDRTATFMGARLIENLLIGQSYGREFFGSHLEYLKSTGRTPEDAIQLAAAEATRKLQAQLRDAES